MIVYQVCGTIYSNQVFKTLREAKSYVAKNETTDFYIQKCKLVTPTIDSMIEIINSQGGSWCAEDYGIVAAGGEWDNEKWDG